MKLKTLAAAIAATTVSLSANALVPGQESAADLALPRIDVYGSGATALDKQLKNFFTNLCRAGSLDIYTDDLSKPQGSSFSAYYCVVEQSAVPGLTSDHRVMLHKRSRGGSAFGVGPVAGALSIDQMTIEAGTAGDPCGTAPAGSDNGVPVWLCDRNDVFQQPSDFGISDVEPTLFTGPNLIDPNDSADINPGDPGTVPLTSAELSAIAANTFAMNATTFGVPVTKNLRDVLQAAQGLPEGSDDVDDMPSLSREMVASIYAGAFVNWENYIVPGTATGLATWADSNTVVGGPALGNSRVNVCRRVEGSGTQAQANAIFLNNPCAAGATPPATDNTAASALKDGVGVAIDPFPLAVPIALIHENSGSGDVTDCLDNLQAANKWAVGVQSLEKGSDDWRFVAINGVAPTLQNVANNTYIDYVTTSMQWRDQTINGVAPPSGNVLEIMKKIRDDAASPSILNGLNAGLNPRITDADPNRSAVGALALPYKPGATPSIPFDASNPVATASREGSTGTLPPNSCRTPNIVTAAEGS